jgi:hypothetical protein
MPEALHSEGSPPSVNAFPSTSGLERSQEKGGEDYRDHHPPHREPHAWESHGPALAGRIWKGSILVQALHLGFGASSCATSRIPLMQWRYSHFTHRTVVRRPSQWASYVHRLGAGHPLTIPRRDVLRTTTCRAIHLDRAGLQVRSFMATCQFANGRRKDRGRGMSGTRPVLGSRGCRPFTAAPMPVRRTFSLPSQIGPVAHRPRSYGFPRASAEPAPFGQSWRRQGASVRRSAWGVVR